MALTLYIIPDAITQREGLICVAVMVCPVKSLIKPAQFCHVSHPTGESVARLQFLHSGIIEATKKYISLLSFHTFPLQTRLRCDLKRELLKAGNIKLPPREIVVFTLSLPFQLKFETAAVLNIIVISYLFLLRSRSLWLLRNAVFVEEDQGGPAREGARGQCF